MGYRAVHQCTTSGDTTGIGNYALYSLSTGNNNTGVGYTAGYNVTTGSNNTIIGRYAGNQITSHSNQVAIGYHVGGAGTGYITLGYGSTVTYIAAGSTSWSGTSDERLKKNIVDCNVGLDFINDLRPVTFNWKEKQEAPEDMPQYEEGSDAPALGKDHTTKHGFIAQEVKEVIENHSGIKDGFTGWNQQTDGTQGVSDGAFIPMLVNAVQELSAKCDSLQNEINILKGE